MDILDKIDLALNEGKPVKILTPKHYKEIIKAATKGLVGDRIKNINIKKLQSRAEDQADKLFGWDAGLDWKGFIDAIRSFGFMKIEGKDTKTAKIIFIYKG